jgi:hypothetical protein
VRAEMVEGGGLWTSIKTTAKKEVGLYYTCTYCTTTVPHAPVPTLKPVLRVVNFKLSRIFDKIKSGSSTNFSQIVVHHRLIKCGLLLHI